MEPKFCPLFSIAMQKQTLCMKEACAFCKVFKSMPPQDNIYVCRLCDVALNSVNPQENVCFVDGEGKR